jgi:hypothetical protein
MPNHWKKINGKEGVMKAAVKVAMAVAVGFGLVTSIISCASTSSQTRGSGFLGDYYKNLQPGPEGGAKMRWLKPGVDFAKYNKVMLESVIFYFANDSENKGIDPEVLKELAETFDLAFVNALKGTYPIVSEPGPDVVRIRVAITDLKQNSPTLGVVSTVTMLSPIGLGVNLAKKGATGSWTGSGATTGEMMAIDSMTNNVIAVAKDERSAGFRARYTNWGSVEEAFKFWGERMRKFLDDAHAVKIMR